MQEKPCHGARQIQICSAGSHNFEGANAEADASVRSRTALDLTSPPWLRGEAARPVASSCMSTSCTRKPAFAAPAAAADAAAAAADARTRVADALGRTSFGKRGFLLPG